MVSCALWRFKLTNLIRSDYTIATDQIIRYPAVSDDSRYTFSLLGLSRRKIIPRSCRSISNSAGTITSRMDIVPIC